MEEKKLKYSDEQLPSYISNQIRNSKRFIIERVDEWLKDGVRGGPMSIMMCIPFDPSSVTACESAILKLEEELHEKYESKLNFTRMDTHGNRSHTNSYYYLKYDVSVKEPSSEKTTASVLTDLETIKSDEEFLFSEIQKALNGRKFKTEPFTIRNAPLVDYEKVRAFFPENADVFIEQRKRFVDGVMDLEIRVMKPFN